MKDRQTAWVFPVDERIMFGVLDMFHLTNDHALRQNGENCIMNDLILRYKTNCVGTRPYKNSNQSVTKP